MSDEKCLIKADEIATMRSQQKVHFLNENARCTNKALGDLTGLTGFGFHIIEVQPGHSSTESHFHYNEDECVYVLSGEGKATIGGETAMVSAGDFMGHRKGGLAHTIKNTGNEVLRCIVVGQRLETDVVEYPNQGKRMFRSPGLSWKVANISDLQERPVPGET